MNSNKFYQQKYLKYKIKYNSLKHRNQKGGNIKKFGSFILPSGIIQLNNGNLVVCDTNSDSVQIFNQNGEFISKRYVSSPNNILKLSNGNFIVSEIEAFGTSSSQINMFNQDDDIVKHIIVSDFDGIGGMTELSNGNLAICDIWNNRIQIITIDGNYISHFNSDKFKNPKYITRLNNDYLAICDSKQHVLIYDLNGVFIKQFEYKFENIKGIIQLSDNNLAVCDNNILIFNLNGVLLDFIIQSSNGITQLNNGNLAVTDIVNKCVHILEYKTNILNIVINNINKFYNITEVQETILIDSDFNIINTLFDSKEILLKPNSKPFFKFINSNTTIDAGGLTKTVFYLLSQELAHHFVYDKRVGFFNLNPSSKLNIYFVGQLFGLAIKLKQLIEIKLSPFLLYQMIKDDFDNLDTKLIIDLLNDYDPELINSYEHPYSCYKNNFSKMNKYCNYNIIDNTIIKNEDIANETTTYIKLFNDGLKFLSTQFIAGFRNQIDVKLINLDKLSLKDFSNLITGIFELNYDLFIRNLKFKSFTDYEQINIIKFIIKQHSINDNNYLKTLLLAMTGSTTMPSVGYGNKPLHIQIINIDSDVGFEFHTCFNQLIINKILFDEYLISENKEQTKLFLGLNIYSLKYHIEYNTY